MFGLHHSTLPRLAETQTQAEKTEGKAQGTKDETDDSPGTARSHLGERELALVLQRTKAFVGERRMGGGGDGRWEQVVVLKNTQVLYLD